MRAIRLFIVFLTLVSASDAQVVTELKKLGTKKKLALDSSGWKHTGLFVLNVNQSSQSGISSGAETFLLGMNMILNKAAHHKKGKYTFDSYLDLELGLVYASSYKKFRKTSDRFDLTLEFDHAIGKNKHFTYGFLGNINTQLFPGYTYLSDYHLKASNILSPGKALISFGVDYKNVKEKSFFSLFVTPATIRWVTKVDRDFYPNYKFGVDSFQKVYTEIGAYITAHYNCQFSDKVSLVSRLDFFSNYKRNPGKIDVFSNNILGIMISKKFSCNFVLDLLYDHDVTTKLQIQQQTGIGLRLKL